MAESVYMLKLSIKKNQNIKMSHKGKKKGRKKKKEKKRKKTPHLPVAEIQQAHKKNQR